jgi:hypothetical protein
MIASCSKLQPRPTHALHAVQTPILPRPLTESRLIEIAETVDLNKERSKGVDVQRLKFSARFGGEYGVVTSSSVAAARTAIKAGELPPGSSALAAKQQVGREGHRLDRNIHAENLPISNPLPRNAVLL